MIKGKIEVVCSHIKTFSSSDKIQTNTVDGLHSLHFFPLLENGCGKLKKKKEKKWLAEKKKEKVWFCYIFTTSQLRISITTFYENISLNWKKKIVHLGKINELKLQPQKDRETMSKMKHHQASLLLILTELKRSPVTCPRLHCITIRLYC